MYAVTQIPWLVEHFSFENLLMLVPHSGYVFYGGLLGVILAIRMYPERVIKATWGEGLPSPYKNLTKEEFHGKGKTKI